MLRALLVLASVILTTASIMGQEVATNTSHSDERQRQLGSEMARDIEAHLKLIEDSLVTEYVSGLARNIAQHSNSRLAFIAKVVHSSEINAIVLPDGYLYVNSGLIAASNSEAELASVLAHETAHVIARHGTRIQRRRRIWRIASFCTGPVGFPVQVIGFLSSMKLHRDAEREADRLGLEYEYEAGYDPQAFVQFLERVEVKESVIANTFGTHPPAKERILRARREISMFLPPDPSTLSTPANSNR